MRVAVVDIGSNSTRLLIADVEGRSITELDRRSIITRLGEGLDATGELGEEPQRRVYTTLDEYAEAIEEQRCDARTVVMTAAVRDAANGAAFAETVRHRYGLSGRTLSGEEEARLSFLGATAGRDPDDPAERLVIDIGGGSTEMVIGRGEDVSFHVSTQVGVVRFTERHVSTDPPAPDELRALAQDARPRLSEAVPAERRERVAGAVAVAGTATSCAAIDLELEPYDPDRVEGHVLELGVLEEMLARLAAMPLAERREVPGLHPDRAPTIVAGVIILCEVLRAFGLEQVEVSERDILWGVALESAAGAAG